MAGRVVSVQQGAYLTAMCHALKYPHASVNGVLLGSYSKDADGLKISVKEGRNIQTQTRIPKARTSRQGPEPSISHPQPKT
mmetsp:Transcript_25304/g.39692  ORF Transcript_25304/g.39692 Transcript_25304/m.39692 type:complete len:81 (-) Transcript_25304:980-1222(-)